MIEAKMIKCIKDVVMDDTGERCFTEGRTYKADFKSWSIDATNDSGEHHALGTLRDKDRFFHEHFIIL